MRGILPVTPTFLAMVPAVSPSLSPCDPQVASLDQLRDALAKLDIGVPVKILPQPFAKRGELSASGGWVIRLHHLIVIHSLLLLVPLIQYARYDSFSSSSGPGCCDAILPPAGDLRSHRRPSAR